MKALFVNYGHEHCGVHEFGVNLAAILKGSTRLNWYYSQPQSREELHTDGYDYVLYNWQSGQSGFLGGAPFADVKAKQILCYHDNDINEAAWDAVIFADPYMSPHGKWHPIGRPIPAYRSTMGNYKSPPTIGVNGFRGAWADRVVAQVIKEFDSAHIRLLLPFSHYCDSSGSEAMGMAAYCRQMVALTPNITLEVSHDFLPQHELLEWLSGNDINCYFRDPAWHWRGVSSSPDAALAVRRPIAVSKCNAFRHLHGTTPSICIEDSSLKQILFGCGLAPLVPLYEQWSAENVCKAVDNVLLAL